MNHENLTDLLQEILGLDPNKATDMLEATVTAIKEHSKDLDTVAVPGFGSFACVKTDECIVADVLTGEQKLLPPKIEMKFKSSVVLRKRFVG